MRNRGNAGFNGLFVRRFAFKGAAPSEVLQKAYLLNLKINLCEI